MEFFKVIIICAYWLFCFTYAANTIGVQEEESFFFRILLVLIAATIGAVYTPAFIAEDLYNKLNK